MEILVALARTCMGALLVIAGALKAHDGPALTASTIAGYRLLPPSIVAPLGVVLPYLEILLGAYLIIGLMTRAVALIAAVQFTVFAVAVASLVVRNIPADCGCFGSGVRTPPSWYHVAADLALAALALLVARFGGGRFSLDRRLLGGGALAEGEAS